jgi:lysozyme
MNAPATPDGTGPRDRFFALRWRWRLAVPILGAIVLALAWTALQRGWVRFNYPGYARYPVQGVDVSHHQGHIDWPKLAGRHAAFAYIKASEGADFRDEDFLANWNGARAAGIAPGAYHYFTLCRTGAEQAANFIATAGATRLHGLPPAVDLEYGGNCARRPDAHEFEAELTVFLDHVERHWGCRPVLYVTPDFYPDYVAGRFRAHPLWVRNVFATPRLPDGRAWRVWQFANRAHLPGVRGFVDRNVFAGSVAEFEAFRCDAGQASASAGAR